MDDLGPGTRLLCVDGSRSYDMLQTGETYTCERVVTEEEAIRAMGPVPYGAVPLCGLHGPDCHLVGVVLREVFSQVAGMGTGVWCSGRFRPLGRLEPRWVDVRQEDLSDA